jgi:hypothetical protein
MATDDPRQTPQLDVTLSYVDDGVGLVANLAVTRRGMASDEWRSLVETISRSPLAASSPRVHLRDRDTGKAWRWTGCRFSSAGETAQLTYEFPRVEGANELVVDWPGSGRAVELIPLSRDDS